MASLSGLQSGYFTDIDVVDTIAINGNIGTLNQVLTSDGTKTTYQNPSLPPVSNLITSGTGIDITATGNPETISTNVKSLVLDGTAVSGTPQTFNPNANGGSQTITINDTDTTYTATQPISLSVGNDIGLQYDNDTIILDGGDIAVAKVPTTLTFTGYDTGTFDGSSALSINLVDTNTTYSAGDNINISGIGNSIGLNQTIIDQNSIQFNIDGTSTTLTGSNYPQKPTVGTYLNLTDTTNIISPYFFHDVYDPSSADPDSLSTSYVAIFSSNLSNTFTAQATTCCIELLTYNYSISGNRWLYFQLGDDYGTEWSVGTTAGGYGTGTRNTARLIQYTDETDKVPVRQTWYLSGLTIGTSYTVNPMAKTSSTLNYIYAGGSYPASILRGYYLPSAGV
tara:strand:- start:149 stop:1333 length:1185 start_codon:yes stop_codon:yes gene_type:complete